MTAAFDAFVRPARQRPQLWRFAAGLLLSFTVYVALAIGVIVASWWALDPSGDPILWAQDIAEADTASGTLVLLATFAGMALGPVLAVRLLHRRPAATLFGARARVLRDFVAAAGVVAALLGLSLLIWSFAYDAVPNLDWRPWLGLLPLTLLGLLLQTGAEELVFRGYMQQQLAARFRSPLVWMVLPSLLFGVVHYDPVTAGDHAWLVVGSAAVFGLIAADLTARTGSIGAAWGFHFANNMLAIGFVATDGTITGLARFTTPYSMSDLDGASWLFATDAAFLVLAWWLVRRAVSR